MPWVRYLKTTNKRNPQMDFLEIYLVGLGGTATALIALGFLWRKLIEVQVSRALEKYKAELEQKSAILKTELSIYAHEQNVGLSRLDQQRSDAICAIFSLITKWHSTLMEITMPNEPQLPTVLLERRYWDLSKALIDSAEAITKELYSKAIFFQDSSHKLIGDFGVEAMILSCDFHDKTFGKTSYNPIHSLAPDTGVLDLITRERKVLADKFMGEFDHIRSQLIQELRLLLKAER
jgi:hypothetical protein